MIENIAPTKILKHKMFLYIYFSLMKCFIAKNTDRPDSQNSDVDFLGVLIC